MKSFVVRRIAPFCLVVTTTALIGCGSGHKQTIYTGNRTVTVSSTRGPNGKTKTVTVNGSTGSMSIGAGSVNVSKLGAPVYPGAVQDQDGMLSMSSDKGTSATVVYKSNDDFSKVESFYKSQLPAGSEKINMTEGDGSFASFQIGDDHTAEQVIIDLSAKKDERTTILISHLSKPAAPVQPITSPTP